MKLAQWSSLRNKLILFLLISIVLPISISILITWNYTKESVKSYYIRENANLMHQGAVNLSGYLERINEATLLIYSNLSDKNSIYQLIQNGTRTWLEEREMYRNLQFMSNSVKEIEQIYLYTAVEDLSYRYMNKLLRNAPGQTYIPALDEDRDAQIEAVHASHEYGIGKPKFSYHFERDVFSFHRKILNAPTDEVLGVISIDIRTDMIDEISRMLYTPGSEELYILDRQGRLIFASDEGAAGDGGYEWVRSVLERTEERGPFSLRGREVRWHPHLREAVVAVDGLDARQADSLRDALPGPAAADADQQPGRVGVPDHRRGRRRGHLLPVHQSDQAALALHQQAGERQSGRGAAINRSDEIGILSKRFHQLMQRINQLIMREYRLELASKSNQLKALQAQINPHFMNNALQSIGTLALQHGDRQVYTLISSLGKMMRYHMRADNTSVPLSAELDYVQSYLALQRQRFDEHLEYRIEADEKAGAVQVPRMVLQLIVENIFKHGIQPAVKPGEIAVVCRMAEPSVLEIRVADNGAGMEEGARARLQAILDRPENAFEPVSVDGGIGLVNILSRLRLFYSDEVRMKLENRAPHGFETIITIPLGDKRERSDESTDRG